MIEIFKKKLKKPVETFNLTYNCGQPFTIEKFVNTGQSLLCHTCHKQVYFQYAIIDGRGEPQGSLYYCKSCNPKDINTVKSHYLLVMGYTN